MRKAYEFNRNLRGAEKTALENGAIRYVKKGYFIIKDEAGNILSYGRVAQSCTPIWKLESRRRMSPTCMRRSIEPSGHESLFEIC